MILNNKKNKDSVEVNNININLNVHLKNSNNANINVNNIGNKYLDIKSPVRTKSNLNAKAKQPASDNKPTNVFTLLI
jgi:hypothetical protein